MESGCKWLHQKLLQLLVAMALCCHGVAMGTVWSLVMRSHPEAGDDCLSWLHLLLLEGSKVAWSRETRRLC